MTWMLAVSINETDVVQLPFRGGQPGVPAGACTNVTNNHNYYRAPTRMLCCHVKEYSSGKEILLEGRPNLVKATGAYDNILD